MSILHWSAIAFISSLSLSLYGNPLAHSGVAVATPDQKVDISDTKFCVTIRRQREALIRDEPALNQAEESLEYTWNSARCFSANENLYYTANQEAQKILGPHAPWYLKISTDFRDRVTNVCKSIKRVNSETNQSYDHCVESRYEELMEPYQAKYQREATAYITKRQDIAKELTTSCDAAIGIKRNQLPKELRFPAAYYDLKSNSVPNWLLAKNLDDNDWLQKILKPNVNSLMHEVLGKDCPGNMVLWVVYKEPGF